MRTIIYMLFMIIILLAIIISIIARKKIRECENEEERRIVKSKWQFICAIFGGAAVLMAGVLCFALITM